jgi:hypothetical protein
VNKKEKEKLEAIETLKAWGLVDGTPVYAQVVQVARSGMSRRVKLYIIDPDGVPRDISYHAAKALEWGYCDTWPRGVRVGGCGMDMLFHTVDCLSYAMGYGCCDQSHGAPVASMRRVGWDKTAQQPVNALCIGLRYRTL